MYCKHQEGVSDFQRYAGHTGIVMLGEGRFIVVPPSVIEKNIMFSWVDGMSFDDLTLASIPEWLLVNVLEDIEPISDPISKFDDNCMDDAGTQIIASDILHEDQRDDIVELPSTFDTKINTTHPSTEEMVACDSILENDEVPRTENNQDWKAPLLFEGVSVAEIKAELLPSWLGEYVLAVSQSTQTPEGMAVMLGLSVVATCVQKRFEVSPYRDDYVETLSLWTVTVLQSSERKSPVMNAMTAPLRAWEKEQEQLLKTTIHETATIINVEQKRIEQLQRDAVKVADSEAREKLISEIHEIQASMPSEVRAPILWVGDITAETLQDLLAEHDEKMAVLSDEGGIFEIMAGLYNDSKVNIDIFLQAYSGSPARIKRKSREVSLDRPALTFGLAVQPTVIEGFASGSKKQFRGKGALGRFLFCIPESMLGKRVTGRRTPILADIKSRYEVGIRGLLSVPMVVNEAGEEMPRMLELDTEALDAWEDFDHRIEGMLGSNGELASMGDWGGKLPGTALRIAGLLHLVEHGPNSYIIGKDTLDRSIGLCNVLIGHTKAAFGLIGADETVSDAKKVFMWMQKKGFEVFTKTECSRALKGISELDSALKTLEERNILKELMVPTKGRDAATYVSNPSLKPTVG